MTKPNKLFLATALLLAGLIGLSLEGQAAQVNYDFCTLTSVDPQSLHGPFPRELKGQVKAEYGAQIWDAVSVQYYTRCVLSQPGLINTPASAYPLAYVAMTAARDSARCGGSLTIANRGDRLIGDLLADVMSRWLVLSARSCTSGAVTGEGDYGLCPGFQRVQRFDALHSALEITGVYLSSHMGMALAAVVWDDRFWQQEFPVETHEGSGPRSNVLAARLGYLRHYKPAYDLNNAFLASNLQTVTASLKKACLVSGPLIPFGVTAVGPLVASPELFRQIRDTTFDSALALAAHLDPSEHPMLVPDGDGYRINYAEFRQFAAMPSELVEAEEHARDTLGLAAFGPAFELFGSLSPASLAATRPGFRQECDYPKIGQ